LRSEARPSWISASSPEPEPPSRALTAGDEARSEGGELAGEDASRERSSRLYPDVLEKLTTIFGTHLADVLLRHRRVETLTGEKNVIGRQNLVEALAHIGVLFARAPELDRDKQLVVLW
jgi:hypothetical protein